MAFVQILRLRYDLSATKKITVRLLSLSNAHYSCLVLVQTRNIRPNINEQVLTGGGGGEGGKDLNQTGTAFHNNDLCVICLESILTLLCRSISYALIYGSSIFTH